MYNQVSLCKQCDEEEAMFNGLCSTCLDAEAGELDYVVGGFHIERFNSHRLNRRDFSGRHPLDIEDK